MPEGLVCHVRLFGDTSNRDGDAGPLHEVFRKSPYTSIVSTTPSQRTSGLESPSIDYKSEASNYTSIVTDKGAFLERSWISPRSQYPLKEVKNFVYHKVLHDSKFGEDLWKP